jgi:hypothetical protein
LCYTIIAAGFPLRLAPDGARTKGLTMVKDEIEIGSLVMIETLFSDNVRTILEKNGTMWIVKSRVLPDGYVWCRSLATGFDFDWHHHDLTLPEKEEEELRAEEACARLGITDEKTRAFVFEHERKHTEMMKAQRKEEEC